MLFSCPSVGINLDSPWSAVTAEVICRAVGRTDLVGAVATVILVVTEPLRGNASSSGTGKLWLQTRGWGSRTSHPLTLPHALYTRTTHKKRIINKVLSIFTESNRKKTDQFWQSRVMEVPGGNMEPSHSHGQSEGKIQPSPVEEEGMYYYKKSHIVLIQKFIRSEQFFEFSFQGKFRLKCSLSPAKGMI